MADWGQVDRIITRRQTTPRGLFEDTHEIYFTTAGGSSSVLIFPVRGFDKEAAMAEIERTAIDLDSILEA
jgi:hypothetical protein